MVHSKKRFWPTKLALGIVSAATVAFVGMAGVASASNGYGGGANIGIDLDVHGSNNVINIIINFIFK